MSLTQCCPGRRCHKIRVINSWLYIWVTQGLLRRPLLILGKDWWLVQNQFNFIRQVGGRKVYTANTERKILQTAKALWPLCLPLCVLCGKILYGLVVWKFNKGLMSANGRITGKKICPLNLADAEKAQRTHRKKLQTIKALCSPCFSFVRCGKNSLVIQKSVTRSWTVYKSLHFQN